MLPYVWIFTTRKFLIEKKLLVGPNLDKLQRLFTKSITAKLHKLFVCIYGHHEVAIIWRVWVWRLHQTWTRPSIQEQPDILSGHSRFTFQSTSKIAFLGGVRLSLKCWVINFKCLTTNLEYRATNFEYRVAYFEYWVLSFLLGDLTMNNHRPGDIGHQVSQRVCKKGCVVILHILYMVLTVIS